MRHPIGSTGSVRLRVTSHLAEDRNSPHADGRNGRSTRHDHEPCFPPPAPPRLRGDGATAAAAISLVPAASVTAVEFPDPGSPLFFQTSGSSAGLNIGDWYTSTGGGSTNHVILLPVPEDWPATQPVTVAVYDPESFDAATGLATRDEVRGPGDATSFRLVDPGGGTLASATFASSAATNGRWVEMATFLPTPGTVYELYSETGTGATANNQRNDDNSWRLSFTSDPDCTVGQPVDTCTGIESGNESDDADGLAGDR